MSPKGLVHNLLMQFFNLGSCGSGDLGDPMVSTLRGASRDVVTVYAY